MSGELTSETSDRISVKDAAKFTPAANLSREAQAWFQPLQKLQSNGQPNFLDLSLDGLYGNDTYTERSIHNILRASRVTDSSEQKLDAKIQPTPAPEAAAKAAHITDTTKQQTWITATESNRTSQKDSATMPSITEEMNEILKANGGKWNKCEIDYSSDLAPAPGNGSAEDTGTVIDYQPQELQKRKLFALGMDYEERRDVRTPSEKLQDFLTVAASNASNPENYRQYIQGELDKLVGIAEGLNIAKEQTKGAVADGLKALTDGRVAEFLSKPNAINEPLFHTVANVFDAMAKDPNATNKALEALGTAMIQASEHYSALPNREKGHVIGETMFALVNPEGSTKSGEAAVKIADAVATHVDAAVMKTIEQSLEAIKKAPDLAADIKQGLYEFVKGKGLTGPELEAAGIPRGFFNDIEREAAQGDNFFAMSEGEGGASAFRRDHDPYSPLHPKGWRKSHINEAGDLEPANPEGIYNGEKMTVCHHLDGGWNKKCKGSSPFTSFSAEDGGVIARYGDSLIKLDLQTLKQAKNAGLVDVDILELPDVLKAIDEAPGFSEIAKNKHRAWARRDNEVLIRGIIPGRFITVEK